MPLSEEQINRLLNPELLEYQFKTCSICSKELNLTKFNTNSNQCKKCLSEISKNKRLNNPAKTTWERARARARKSGVEFTITPEDVQTVWTDICPIYHIPLKTNNQKPGPDSHSIDRIDNSKGYIPGNIAIVSMKFNSEKRNLTPEILKRMLLYIEGRLIF